MQRKTPSFFWFSLPLSLSPSLPLSLSLARTFLNTEEEENAPVVRLHFWFCSLFLLFCSNYKHVYNSQSRSMYTRILTHATQYAIHEHLCLAVGGLWLSFVAGPGSDESHTPLCSLYETSSMHCTGCCSWWLCVARHNPWQRVTSHELTTLAH